MKFNLLFLLTFISFHLFAQSSNTCTNAPIQFINPSTSSYEILINGRWSIMTESGLNNSCPELQQNPSATYEGKDTWIQFDSEDYQYLAAAGGNGKQVFNLYTSCSINNKVSRSNLRGIPVYELTPNTNYWLQVLKISEKAGSQNVQISESVELIFQKAIPQSDCNTPFNITANPFVGGNPIYYPTMPDQPIFALPVYLTFTLSESGTIKLRPMDKLLFGSCGSFVNMTNQGERHYNVETGQTYFIEHNPSSNNPGRLTFYSEQPNETCDLRTGITIGTNYNINNFLYRTEDSALPRSGFFHYANHVPAIGLTGGKIFPKNCNSLEQILANAQGNIYGLGQGVTYIVATSGNESSNIMRVDEIDAPTTNNNFTTRIQIADDGVSHTADFTHTSNSSGGADPTNPNIGDVWYQINNTSERITLQNLTFDQDYSIYIYIENNSNELELIHEAAINSQGNYSFPILPVGQDYYMQLTSTLKVGRTNINNKEVITILPDQNVTFSLSPATTTGNIPINDECSGAIPFADRNMIPAQDIPNANAHPNTIPVCNDPADYYQPTYWFAETTTTNPYYSLSDNVTIYTGSCGALSILDCPIENVEGTRIVELNPVENYLFSATSITGTTITALRASADLNCDDNEPLPIATISTPLPEAFRNKNYSPYDPLQCNDGAIPRKDGWLHFTVPNILDQLTISARTQKYAVSLYEGTCNSLVETFCEIVEPGQEIQWDVTPGSSYILRIAGNYTSGDIEYSFAAFPEEDDDCATASTINISILPTNIDRSQSYAPSTPDFSCSPESLPDFWKSFTAPSSGIAIVETTQQIDEENPYFVELYTNCNTPISGSCSAEAKTIYDALTPGQSYLLRFNADKGNEKNTFIYTTGLPSANNDCSNATFREPRGCSPANSGQTYGMPNGAWYSASIPSHGGLAVTTDGNFTAYVYYKDCSDLVLYDSLDTSGEIVIQGLPAGELIYINIKENSTYRFCLTVVDDINHDNTLCEFSEHLNNIDVSECLNPNAISLSRPFRPGRSDIELWYDFTASSDAIELSIENIEASYSGLMSIAVFDACGGEQILALRGNFIGGLYNLTQGQQYFIRIRTEVKRGEALLSCINDDNPNACLEEALNSSQLNFDICLVEFPPAAANDECAQATPLTLSTDCAVVVQDSTHGAYDTKYDCFEGSKELWYSYTAADNINLKINAFNSTSPLNIAVFENGCDGRPIICAKDSAIIIAQTGVEYAIAISKDPSASNTTYDLCLSELVIEGSTDNVGIDVSDPAVKLQVAGAITVGMDDVPIPGALRFTGQDFQGFTSSGWQSFTQSNEFGIDEDGLGNHLAFQDLNMAGNQIENLAIPEEDHQAANKAYVDLAIMNLSTASEIDSAATSDSENFYLEKINDEGISYDLKLDTPSGTLTADMNPLFGGWQYGYAQDQPYTWSDGINVGIGVEEATTSLQIGNGEITRFNGTGLNVIDFTSESENLLIDFYHLAQTQSNPHLKLGGYFTIGNDANFDFDIYNEKLGIGKVDPSASLHFDKNNGSDYLNIDKNGTTQTVIDEDGHIGIGTTDPSQELDVRGTVHIEKNSSSGDPHLNIVESGTDFIRLYMENNTGNRAVIAAKPESITDDSKINFFLDGPGDVMTIRGNKSVGVNNTNPTFPLHIGTSTSNGNGAHVTTGGTWTNGSSRTFKDNFEAVNHADILTKLAGLNVLRWNYIGSDEGAHLGPIAEEFHAAFGLGNNEKYISTVDADGVALAAIKALYDQNQELFEQNQNQQKEIDELKVKFNLLLEKLSEK